MIAGRLGLSETAVRKGLARLGWNPDPEQLSSLPENCFTSTTEHGFPVPARETRSAN